MAYETPAAAPTAEKRPAVYGDPMTEEDVERLVGEMIADAQEYVNTEIAPDREKATKYYNGEKFGNEEEGRSQVVTTDVRDAIRSVMPTLLRVFTGPERYVEYAPRGPGDEQAARQRTDYVNYVLNEFPNNAFKMYHAWFKDALVRKVGFVKWWWDDTVEYEEADYTGLTQDQLDNLLSDEEVEVDMDSVGIVPANPKKGVPETFDVHVKRVRSPGRLRVEAVPTEEIFWDRNARNFHDARIVVHSREVRVNELLDMGYDEDDIADAIGPSAYHQEAREKDVRQLGGNQVAETPQSEATRPIRYCEAYAYLPDPEDKGRVKLCKVCTVGDKFKVIDKRVISHRPIAYLICDPEPHTINGLSYADDTMDFQEVGSAVWRGLLDSLALALVPRTEAVENMVNLQDLMNTEIGAITRVRQPGMLREIAHRFVGGDIIPALDGLAEMKENRLGISKAAAGLDADALQSSTKAAVAATLSKAQERVELLARTFAETGVRDLYRGILRTITEHQDHTKNVRLRGQYTDIDPRGWEADADVIVNIALGAGLTEEKVKALGGFLEEMKALMQMPNGHLVVTMSRYRNVLARITELLGYPNPDDFWRPLTEEEEQQALAAQAQQPPPGDPAAQAIAQAEVMRAQAAVAKMQADMQNAQQELELRRQEMQLRDDRERDKQASDHVLKMHELSLKYGNALDRANIDADVAARRAALDADVKLRVAEIQAKDNPDVDGGAE